MKVESVRVQDFRCIRDSGDLPLTGDLTILIGENESGKSSLLDALVCFNEKEKFQDVDLSTMSPTRGSVLSEIISRDTVDIVTVSVKLTTSEREQLNIPASVLLGDTIRVTKRLDNSYVFKGSDDSPLPDIYARIMNRRLLVAINGIRRQIGSIYQGFIVRKFPMDQFVFIRRSEDDPETADLILFPSVAGELWEDLSQGDVVQVTHQAPDPYGRNARAMNVGKYIDLESELEAVEDAINLQGHELTDSLKSLLSKVHSIPHNHPLRSVFDNEFRDLLQDHIETSTEKIPWDDTNILEVLPRFERRFVAAVNDKLPLMASDESTYMGDEDGGLLALIDEVGLSPTEAVTAEPTERLRIFDEKSQRLSEIFTDSWVTDVQAELVPFNQDRNLGLAITSQGSLDPPSRRSQGFNSYLGLTARLIELRKQAKKPLVLILDDPAMHLHPTAQEKLAQVLSEQPFQVLVATHFPFMIESNHLDRVRLLSRTESGAHFEEDWRLAGDGLLPVKGAISRWTLGRVPLLVEGKTDRAVLNEMSEFFRKEGRDSMPTIIEPVPSGGSAMPEMAKALRAMDISFIALVDGDEQGDDIRKKLIKEVEQPETGIMSLRDIISGVPSPAIENLFSEEVRNSEAWKDGNVLGTLDALKEQRIELDDESAENLNKLFGAIDDALNTAF